jgi:tyrosinase
LHYFESVVRQTIADLGGPDDWALPYWDYSDPQRPNVRRLPPAFREPQMPSGDPNPLFVSERAPDINQGGELDPRFVNTDDAMAETSFRGPGVDGMSGFGGPVTGWNHSAGQTVGILEARPHGAVHVGVGGIEPPGWMSAFDTAARDPIFWLHHANIDRLWEAWLALGDDRANLTGARWRNMWYKVGGGAYAVTLSVREVLDTTQPPLTYRYSKVSIPAPGPEVVEELFLAARRDAGSLSAEERPVPEELFPEMVGASEDRVPLAAAPSEVEVAVEPPSGPAFMERAEGAQPRKVYLKVENVRGKELAAPGYLVYVNLPPGADSAEYEDRRAGLVSMFGVMEASESDEEHSGSGLSFSFDITGIVQRLRETGDWDPQRLRVTFTPVGASAEQGGDVNVGRVSLFYA